MAVVGQLLGRTSYQGHSFDDFDFDDDDDDDEQEEEDVDKDEAEGDPELTSQPPDYSNARCQVTTPDEAQLQPHPDPHGKSHSHHISADEVSHPKNRGKGKVVDNIVELVSCNIPKVTVTRGYVVSTDPTKVVGAVQLGSRFCEVHVTQALRPHELLMMRTKYVHTIGDAIGESVTWLSDDLLNN